MLSERREGGREGEVGRGGVDGRGKKREGGGREGEGERREGKKNREQNFKACSRGLVWVSTKPPVQLCKQGKALSTTYPNTGPPFERSNTWRGLSSH